MHSEYRRRPSSAPNSRKSTVRRAREGWQTESDVANTNSSDNSLLHAIRVIQDKYSQNIDVIEQLFHEKEDMADQVKHLEKQLEWSRLKREEELKQEQFYDFDFDFNIAQPALKSIDDGKSFSGATTPHVHSTQLGLVSAAEAANMFSDSDDQHVRAGSAGRRRATKSFFGATNYRLSPQLQADTDRYLQKIKYVQDKKKLEILEQEKYELELEKRRLRASKSGGEFTSMRAREERAREIKKYRDERKLRKEMEMETHCMEQKNTTLTTHVNLRNSLKDSKSWEDIQKEEEIRRRDRIEKRKQHLASSAAYPSTSIVESVDKWKNKDIKPDNTSPQILSCKAPTPSPAEIGAQLKRRQEKWERHLQQEKELHNSKRKNTLPVKAALEMEQRQKVYDENRRRKQEERAEKEEDDKNRRVSEERKRTEKIMRSHVPESSRRLTKASEERAKAVRDNFEKIRKTELEEKKKELLKSRRSKEMSAFLKTLVGAQDGSSTEADRLKIARQHAEENAVTFKENRRKNQERIRASLAQRPSLIERHEMTVASTSAATSALSKVANVVRPSTGQAEERRSSDTWRNDFESEDLFDESEKIQLGIRT